jgi:hypothetical protein
MCEQSVDNPGKKDDYRQALEVIADARDSKIIRFYLETGETSSFFPRASRVSLRSAGSCRRIGNVEAQRPAAAFLRSAGWPREVRLPSFDHLLLNLDTASATPATSTLFSRCVRTGLVCLLGLNSVRSTSSLSEVSAKSSYTARSFSRNRTTSRNASVVGVFRRRRFSVPRSVSLSPRACLRNEELA